MNRLATIATLIAVALAGVWVGRGCTPEEAGTRTEIVYRDRPIAPRDTARQAAPEQVIRYRTVREVETRRDTVRVPLTIGPPGRYLACPPQPVALTPRRVVLTAFDVQAQRWEQRRYAVPRARWGYALALAASDDVLTPGIQPSLSLRASVRYRRVSAFATPSIIAHPDGALSARARVGIAITILSR